MGFFAQSDAGLDHGVGRHCQVMAKNYPSFSSFTPPCIFAPCRLSGVLTKKRSIGDLHSLDNAICKDILQLLIL